MRELVNIKKKTRMISIKLRQT